MGIAIPQVITSDRATGAQVIDGSLKFDKDKLTYLSRTPGSSGDRNNWTISCWLKRDKLDNNQRFFESGNTAIRFGASIFQWFDGPSGSNGENTPAAKIRDTSGWYHCVFAWDSSAGVLGNRIYLNGVELDYNQTGTGNPSSASSWNTGSQLHTIGQNAGNTSRYYGGRMSQVYFIDGQTLTPEYFGYTDGLTNTWRPKKYEGTFGTNGFYLPMDGNSPIGQDKSGNGNDWTPVNFGGSVALDNPQVSGARPILNTTQGGTKAGVGVFGSRENVGYAVTYYDDGGGNKYYIDGVKQATLTGLIRGATYTFDTVALGSTHPFRFSDSDGGSEYTNGVAAITGTATTITIPYDAPETLYYYCTVHSGMGSSITGITTNEKLADQYASNCVLALPLIGANSDVSASIACTQTNYSVTSNGNASASSDKSNFYSGSFEFDGDGDSLTFTTSSDLSLDGDFTIEFWINNDTITVDTQHPSPITMPTDGSAISQIYTQSSNDYYGLYRSGDIVTTGNNSALTDVWQHVAFTRSGSTCYAFLNGVLKNTATSTATFGGTSGTYRIGSYDGSGGDVDGYIQDLRIYKGVAKYTSDFVVPATSPDILPDTPSGVSGGSKLTKITDGAVHFDNSGDSLTVADNADFDLGTNSFTIECFAYLETIGQFNNIFAVGTDSSNGYRLDISTSNNLRLLAYIGGSWSAVITGGTALASNKWYHLAVTRSGNNFDLWVDGIKDTTTVSNSGTITNPTTQLEIGRLTTNSLNRNYHGFISNLRFVNGSAVYTSPFTPPTAPITSVENTKLLCCQSNTLAGSAAVAPNVSGVNDGRVWSTLTSGGAVNASYPMTQTFDGSTSTTGVRAVSGGGFIFGGSLGISYSSSIRIHSGVSGVGTQKFKLNDGSATDFAENTWVTVVSGSGTLNKLEITAGSTGNANIYLGAVEIDGTILVDPVIANGDAAATNFNPFNTDINTVRGQETGYATLNPLASASTLSNGNLTMTSGAAWGSCLSTISFTGGKYYWETYVVSSNYSYLGVSRSTHLSSQYPSQNKSWALLNDGNCYYDQLGGEAITVNTGTAVPAGATVGTAVDADSGKIWWSVNGVWIGSSGVPNNGNGIFSNIPTDESLVACVDVYSNTATMNFGQKPFKFPPPAGFQPLNAANVRPETVIVRPDQYVGVTTYTGTITDTSSQTVTGLNFESNLVWIKRRDGTNSHQLVDSVRGTGKWLESSGTAAENSTNTNGVVTDINSNGFTLTGGSTNANLCCEDGFDYVGWCWKAGGNSNTFNIDDVGYDTASAAGLTAGTKTPTGASVNTKSGFSIIAFTGDETAGTISHGLGKAPSFYIVKTRDSNSGGSNDWYCYHSALGASARIQLNSTAAQTTGSSQWNSTSPTSSVLSLGSGAWQETGDRFIIYAWAEIPGFSKFGSYTGNGSADGPVIITGFRPKLILIKRYDSGSTASWHLYDSERAQYNVITTTLAANEYSGESLFSSGYDLDFLSNGVKIRAATSNAINTASGTYIYAAWAEAPSVNLYGAQSNAR